MPNKSRTVNQVQDTAEETEDVAANNAQAAGEIVKRLASDAVDAAREKGADWAEGGQAAVAEVSEQVAAHVKAHAGSSLLIAAFIGFLIGLMFCRRSSD